MIDFDTFQVQISKRINTIERQIRELFLRVSQSSPKRFFLPFGTYLNLNPMVGSGYPYNVSIGYSMTLVEWVQTFRVTAPNNGTNYFIIELRRWNDGALIKGIDTSAAVGGVITQIISTTFTIGSLDATMFGLYCQVTMVGAPGAMYMYVPTVEITIP